MKKNEANPKTVLETILDWSDERPDWQRDALRRIVAKGRLNTNDIGELVVLCKQGRGQKNPTPKPALFMNTAQLEKGVSLTGYK